MKIISRVMTLLVLVLFVGCAGQTGGGSTSSSTAGKALAIVKPATLSTGAVVRVPLFVDQNEMIKVDTRSREYVSRVK